MNKNLAKQFYYVLNGSGEYTVDFSKYNNIENVYVILVKENENEIQLLPTNEYLIKENTSSIELYYPEDGFKWIGILENISLPTFNWTDLASLSELTSVQLDNLNKNFEQFVKDIYETITEYNPVFLTNNIDKDKYVLPKLKVGEIFVMGEDGIYNYQLIELLTEIIATGGVGNLSSLKTVDKSNAVNAINEIFDNVEQNTEDIGDLTLLPTTDKSSIVGAITEATTTFEEGLSLLEKKAGNKYTFDTLTEAQSADWLEELDVLQTLGKTTKGDGLGRKYIVKSTDNDTFLPYGDLFFNLIDEGDSTIGSVSLLAHENIPNWAVKCDGTEYLITQMPQLFAKIGNAYGGDGITTFKVPNITNYIITL